MANLVAQTNSLGKFRGRAVGLESYPTVGGTATSTSIADQATQPVVTTRLSLNGETITIANGSTKEYGSLKILDMPAGRVKFLGASANLTVTAGSGINADFDGDFGIGSTAATDADLATTQQNLIPKTATPQASGSETTATGGSTAALYLDGSATAVDLYLNFIIDSGEGVGDITVTGDIYITWVLLGPE